MVAEKERAAEVGGLAPERPPGRVYLGTFLVAFATLALEVTLTRILSVTTWYHLAFFAVSVAMLGMTAGSVFVYLHPARFAAETLSRSVSMACVWFSLAIPVTLWFLCGVRLDRIYSAPGFLALIATTAACALPFYFSGVAISAVITKCPLPIGRLYASDLIGASLGCLFVLGGLEVMDAPGLILLCGLVGMLAAFSFAWRGVSRRERGFRGLAAAGLLLLVMAHAAGLVRLQPVWVKGRLERPQDYILDRWNSFSRVVVHRRRNAPPQYWGPSPVAPRHQRLPQHAMVIDGSAGTSVRRFSSPADIEHLRYDVTSIGYFLRPRGGACIIGAGGGRDLQSALLFGHQRVVGIDVNPIFIRLLQNEFREFAGVGADNRVSLVVDEARAYLSRSKDRFAVIQMSLVDTWAGTAAGAYTLSENALYTMEAWGVFLDRLADDGIFTVSRWYRPADLRESGRVVSLAAASLLHRGVADPSRHIALVTSGRISTLLLSKRPFTETDVATLGRAASGLRYHLAILPGSVPKHPDFRDLIAARTTGDLRAVVDARPLNYEPPTDENPYFFNMVRLGDLREALSSSAGVLRGNLNATLALLWLIVSLLAVTLATVILPLARRPFRGAGAPGAPPVLWSGALYFSLIGAGFMFLEIALIQRLSVFLSHPVYALGVLLFTIIASTGVGSFLSDSLPLSRRPWVFVYPPAMVAAIVVVRFALPLLLAAMVTAPLAAKITASVLALSPLGVLMGLFFPTGMRLVRAAGAGETPWYWALNGAFGVLASALATFVSIFAGISTNYAIAAACYLAVLASVADLHRRGGAERRAEEPQADPITEGADAH
ncbi:MAG: hypothetical protein HY321_07155 [Armatimonadetes bacterium]|nr:hypothetical protein [Armatimonadota bacterium]